MKSTLLSIAFIFAGLTASFSADFTILGTGEAAAVSGDGSTVVGGINGHAAKWTAASGLVSIGSGSPIAVSYDGSVIVGIYSGTSTSNTGEAFRWTASDGQVGLGYYSTALGGGQSSAAWGVSEDGSTIAGSSSSPYVSINGTTAAIWTSSSGWQLLTNNPDGSYTRGISGNGNVVIGYITGSTTGFQWTSASGIQNIDSPSGNIATPPAAITPDGSIIAGLEYYPGPFQAYILTTSGMTVIDTPGYQNFQPFAISADGRRIIGQARSDSEGDIAVVWDASSGMESLKQMLIDEGATGMGGYQLQYATGISYDGTTISGNAWDGTQSYAFVAHVNPSPAPEPSTMLLLLGGIGALSFIKRRRQ